MSYQAVLTTHDQEHPRLTPAVQTLIGINVAMVFLQLVGLIRYEDAAGWLGFDGGAMPGRWWTAFTYMFVHAGLLHLTANMYGLYMFGPRLEQAWGFRKFTWFYVACGLGGATIEMIFFRTGGMVGATAPVLGVMTAYAMQWPDDEVYLFFVVPMRARSLVVSLAALNVVMGLIGTTEGTNMAYFAHVGGVFAAYAYMRMAASAGMGMDQVRQRVANLPEADEPPRAIPRSMPRRERLDEIDDVVAKSKAMAAKRVASSPPVSRTREVRADELNRVLDKILAEGIDSLTTDERRVLDEMSRKLRDV